MIKFDQFQLWQSLYKTLKKIYSDNMYLTIDSILIDFPCCETNEILALEPLSYSVNIRFGSESQKSNTSVIEFDKSMQITFDADSSFEEIAGIFLQELEGNI